MKKIKIFTCTVVLAGLTSSALGMEQSRYLKLYPLPQLSKAECEQTSVDYWQGQAQRLTSTKALKKSSRGKLNRELEDHIQKNALITLAYTRIAKKSYHRELYPIWMFAGANASHIVGKSLKLNYKYINDIPLLPGEKLDFISAQAFKQRALGNQVASGNQGVYLDIFWKYLSADICGVDNTIRLLSSNRIKYYKEILAWQNFVSSRSSKINKSQALAIDYVNIEQRLLQDIMYESISSRITNSLRLFNHFAELELTMPEAPLFKTFDQYSARYRDVSNNLADFDSRVSWMKYLIRSMTPYIHSLYKSHKSRTAFRNLEKLNLNTIN